MHTLMALVIAATVTSTSLPRVWIDKGRNVFHSPGCKLVTTDMMMLSRTAAQMQGIRPAHECAQTDAQAREEWRRISAVNPSLATPGRVSESGGVVSAPQIQGASASRATPQQKPTKPEPSWNEFMAATDYTNAKGRALMQCAKQWPDDPGMQQYCFQRQLAAIERLRTSISVDDKAKSKRVRCAQQWPNDYRMRARCESQ